MSIETFLTKYPELKEVDNTYLADLIKEIVELNDSFCKNTMFFSMRMMKYDQTVGMFIKDSNLFNYQIIGCDDLVEFPRGMILHSKENINLAVCFTLNFMIHKYYIPLEFVDEIPIRQTNSLKQIYKLKRTSGKIQNCILGNNHAIFLKSTSNQIYDELSSWRIRVLFNEVDDDSEEIDNKNLEDNITTYEKCICIKEFCELNGISKITFNVSKLKNHLHLVDDIDTDYDSDSSDGDLSDGDSLEVGTVVLDSSIMVKDNDSKHLHAVYNNDGVINTKFIEHSVKAKKYSVDYYISQLDIFIETILPYIRKKINMDII